jgi:hypothetical protein
LLRLQESARNAWDESHPEDPRPIGVDGLEAVTDILDAVYELLGNGLFEGERPNWTTSDIPGQFRN